MVALIGQCRGDLDLFVRQLAAVHVSVTRAGSGFSLAFKSPLAPFVVLGDIVSPLNAWCTSPEAAPSQDASVLQLMLQVSEAVGAGIVPGLHELLLLDNDTSRCQVGTNHRRLLALVRSAPFRSAFGRATRRAPPGISRAARSIAGIVHDNASRPAPAGFEPFWVRLGALDRGTRFVMRAGGALVDVPHVGLASSALAPRPTALAEHCAFEYNRLRCDHAGWSRAVAALARQYAEYERLRRRCIAVRSDRSVVADHVGRLLEDSDAFAEALERQVGVIASRYSTPATPAQVVSTAVAAFERL
jgi:hypothetical protein